MTDQQDYNAILTIESTQWEEGDTPETTRLTTEGRMRRAEDAWVLTYEENDASGMGGTKTTIRAEDDGGIALTRKGDMVMRMHFRQGRQHITNINTPYGVINVTLLAHKVTAHMTPDGGDLDLSYAIDSGDHHNINTRMHIDVRCADPGGSPAG